MRLSVKLFSLLILTSSHFQLAVGLCRLILTMMSRHKMFSFKKKRETHLHKNVTNTCCILRKKAITTISFAEGSRYTQDTLPFLWVFTWEATQEKWVALCFARCFLGSLAAAPLRSKVPTQDTRKRFSLRLSVLPVNDHQPSGRWTRRSVRAEKRPRWRQISKLVFDGILTYYGGPLRNTT